MDTLKKLLELVSRVPSWIDGLVVLFVFAAALWKNRRKEVSAWQSRIGRQFKEGVELYGLYRSEPRIEEGGSFERTPALKKQIKKAAEKLREEGRENQQLLTLPGCPDDWKLRPIKLPQIDWKADQVVLPAKALDYATVVVLRERGCFVPLLSANAVLVCAPLGELILQCRDERMDTYGGQKRWVHTIGGGYKGGMVGDRFKLRNTAVREVYEETGVHVSIPSRVPLLLMQETDTGFIQAAFLGVTVARKSSAELSPGPEGTIRRVPFEDLEQALIAWDWVPTGKVAVLAWLALGAPNAGVRPRFGEKSPQQLFESLVRTD